MKQKAKRVEAIFALKRKYLSLNNFHREKLLKALGSKNSEFLLKHV